MNKAMIFDGRGLTIEEYDGDSLEFLQKSVGGYIERIPLRSLDNKKIDMWCNENGKLIGLPLTLMLFYQGKILDGIVGNVVFTKTNDDGDTISLTEKDIKYIKKLFSESPRFKTENLTIQGLIGDLIKWNGF